jgi:hypothetical protein
MFLRQSCAWQKGRNSCSLQCAVVARVAGSAEEPQPSLLVAGVPARKL